MSEIADLAKVAAERQAAEDQAVIDIGHLAAMTAGDHALEAEVLELFDRQAGLLLTRMQQASTAGVVGLAHTLAGSARGIGAWRVAAAAEAVESAAGDPVRLTPELKRLAAAIAETQLAIRRWRHPRLAS